MPAKRARRQRTVPAYLALADAFRAQIRSGAWPSGAKIPPLRTLAAKHRAGQQIVRMALDVLKNEARIAPTGRRRWVVKRPKGGGMRSSDFVLVIAAYGLKSALASADTRALLDGMRAGLSEVDCPYLCLPDYLLRNRMPSAQVLGLPLKGILLSGQIRPALLKRYEKLNLPVVLVDRPCAAWRGHAVVADNEAIAHDATVRLLKQGHTPIAFVRRVQLNLQGIDEDAREREAGYRRALKEAGARAHTPRVFNYIERDRAASPWLKSLLDARPAPTAVLATDPVAATVVAEAARARGWELPRDLSLVSFQGSTRDRCSAAFDGPALDFFEMARRGALLLDAPRRPIQVLRMPAEWRTAGSTAGPAQPQ